MITRQKFLTDEEIQALLKVCSWKENDRDSILIRVSLYTGARSCEVLALKPEDLHENAVTVRGAKGSNNRTVPLPVEFFQTLKRYADKIPVGNFLFPITTRQFRRIWAQWRPLRNPKLHGLRHTFGVKFYNNSRNIHATKTFLGHRNLANTMVYLDFVESVEQMRSGTNGMWTKAI